MKKETLKKLSDALRENVYRKIPNLHHGGCGFAALALYDALSKKGESVTIMSRGDYGHLTVKLNTGVSIFADEVLLDSKQVMPVDDRWWETDRPTLSDCLKEEYRWNPDFNRDYSARIRRRIFKIVNEVLTD